MTQRVTFEVTATSAAQRDAVFALVQAGDTWPTWSPIGSFELHQTSPDGGEGLGAIRYFKTGTVTSKEEIVTLIPGRQLSYRAFAGLPLRDHLADLELSDAPGGGTTIVWREAFEPKLLGTGWFLRWFLHRFVEQCVEGLARYAEQHPTTATPSAA